MKLLFISGAFPPMQAGEATNAVYLSRHLADRGLDVHVLTTAGCGAASYPGVTLHPIMHKWSWSEAPRFARFLRHCRPDAIYLLYLGWIYNYQFMVTFAATIAKRLLPEATFVTRFENVMGADPRHTSLLARGIRKAVERWDSSGSADYCFGTLLRDSNRIIVLSEYHRILLSRINGSVDTKSALIPPPPNMRMCPENHETSRQRGREALGVRPDEFLLVYIGYIHAGKGLETLLRAFQMIHSRRTNVRLVLVGGAIAAQSDNPPSYVREIQEFARDLGIESKLTWTGSYSWDTVEASLYLHAADACVLPFNTGVHLNNSSFSSAASHGLPIITTRGEILDAPVVDRENVLLCPPKNPEATAAAIEAVIDDTDLRHRLGRGAKRLADEWLSWGGAVERTIETLRSPGPGDRVAMALMPSRLTAPPPSREDSCERNR